MKLEKINKKHVKETANLLREYWKERGMKYTQKWTENYLSKGHLFEFKNDVFFSIKDKNKLIGCMSIIVWEGDVAEIRDFIIKKEHRGKGHGKKALTELIKWCKKNNVRKVYALTIPQAFHLMHKKGFNKEGLLKGHFAKGEDLIIMSRFLS